MKQKILIAACLIALACAGLPASAFAQFYKGKTITMIINYPAGGPTDIEGRIVAQHLSAHIPGNPTIVIKNVGGAGGIIGSNQLGEASPNGETIGFFTLDMIAELVGNTSIRTNYSDFLLIAGVESPLVAYMRKDTPPGVNVATDLMKTKDFKALSLNAQNSNTVNQLLALDLLGVKYQSVPAYRGLREVETAILQNIGQLANSSLAGWTGSVQPTMGPSSSRCGSSRRARAPPIRAAGRSPTCRRSRSSMRRFTLTRSSPAIGAYEALRAALDPQLAMFRVAMMPPKTSDEAVAVMRTAFVELWKNPQFMADYSKIVKTEPILVTGNEAQGVLAELGKVPRAVRDFLIDYTTRITAK